MIKVTKILLVGFGSIGNKHLQSLKKIAPEVEVVILRSHSLGNPVDDCVVVKTVDEALAFCPEAAIICNPSSFHLEVSERLVREGVHLLIEKPLSNTVSGVRNFIDSVNEAELKVMVAYNLRFSESLNAFKDVIDSSALGRVLHVHAEVGQFLPNWRPNALDYRDSVSAKSELGGGALLELSHELDYLCWIFGSAISVSARAMKVSDLEIDVEDLVIAQIDLFHKGKVLSASIHLDFLQQRPCRACKAICEKGTVVWDAIAGKVEIQRLNEVSTCHEKNAPKNVTYEKELLAFIEAIEKDTDVPITCTEGLKVLELIEAARKSSKLNKVVFL